MIASVATTSYGCVSLVENRGNESRLPLFPSLPSFVYVSSPVPPPFRPRFNAGCYNAFGLVVGRKRRDQFDPSKYCTVSRY